MRLSRTSALHAGIVGVLLATSGVAGELGDPAPALKIAKWVKGDAVDLEKGKDKNVFVVEFWATWCPPCRASIPHLSEVAKKYRDKGVVIVGVTNEPDLEKVGKFVEGMGDKMDYVVAQDDGGETSKRYMQAFGQRGIPHAFIVDKKGQIVWHGHPMANLDKVLEAVLSGTHSIEDAKAEAKRLAEMRERSVKLAASLREYFELIRKTETLGDQLLKDGGDNPMFLNQLAWGILTNEGIRGRDLDLALRVARVAYDVSEGKDAAIADTFARALFDTGRKEDAIELQRKAVKICTNEVMKADLEKTLAEYEKALKSRKPPKAEKADSGSVRL